MLRARTSPLTQSRPQCGVRERPFVGRCEAARAGVCAHKSGKFEAYYETVFERQSTLAAGKPAAMLKELGIDSAAFAACDSSDETRASVTRDIEEGIQLGH